MVAFLRSYTDDDVVQISDDRIYFSSEASGSIDNNGSEWSATSVPQVMQRTLTINGVGPSDNPMFALTSSNVSTWAYLDSSTSSSVTYRIYRSGSSSPGGTISWWLFSTNPPPAPSSGAAIVLRNASNRRVYSSDTPIARVLGIYDENGYQGNPTSGKALAHVPLKLGKSSYTNYYSGDLGSCNQGTSGGPGYQRYVQTGGAYILMSLTGSSPVNDQIGYQTGLVPTSCDPSPGPEYTSSTSSLGKYSSLILDVTHY